MVLGNLCTSTGIVTESGRALVYGRNQLCQLFPFGACVTVDHQLGINLVDILFHSAFREKLSLGDFTVAQMVGDQSYDFCLSAV